MLHNLLFTLNYDPHLPLLLKIEQQLKANLCNHRQLKNYETVGRTMRSSFNINSGNMSFFATFKNKSRSIRQTDKSGSFSDTNKLNPHEIIVSS